MDIERERQAAFRATSAYFSEAARTPGEYRSKPYSFMLPASHQSENLFVDIRQPALAYFAQHGIHWHMLNHLCSSQVCFVNFLFPFMNQPDALADLLRPVFPSIRRMLPLESPESFVAFEWIGNQNYLSERTGRNAKRTRGANFTSADAMVMFEREDNLRQIVLIEWKYTESYSGISQKVAPSGTDRSQIYAMLYEHEECPLDKTAFQYDDLFYEPFYQLMRQQFLANEMERAREWDADVVSLLHIAPANNRDFKRVTSPGLLKLGGSTTEVWKNLVKKSDRFTSMSTEALFGKFPIDRHPDLLTWWEYIHQRYAWLKQ